MHEIRAQASEILTSTKAATVSATATTTSGVATFLEWIPSDIGKLATLIGIVLSSVLIYTHIKKAKRDKERHELEIAILRKQLNND